MQLGRAEEKLDDQPEVAELVRQARAEAGSAIAELRDLARGIAPPVLADRGLAAAIEASGSAPRSPSTVDAVDRRAPATGGRDRGLLRRRRGAHERREARRRRAGARAGAPGRRTRWSIEVADTGPGGADPDGSGLTGLRHRVEALDGRLRVTSPAGGGTTVRAELPCGS